MRVHIPETWNQKLSRAVDVDRTSGRLQVASDAVYPITRHQHRNVTDIAAVDNVDYSSVLNRNDRSRCLLPSAKLP